MNNSNFWLRHLPGLAALCLLGGLRPAAAQGWTGLAQSNYGGTNALYLNPASLADSRHRFYLNVVGVDFNFYNSYLQLDLPGPAREFIDGTRPFRKEYLNEQLAGRPVFASITGEGRLPSLQLALGPRQGIAFTNRVRAFVQANNVSESLARLGRYGFDQADELGLADRLLTDNRFVLTAGAYHEFALSYARTLTANQTHFWKAGATVKYLVGLGGGYLQNDGTSYQVYDSDSIQVQSRNLSYGFVNPDLYNQKGFTAGSLYGAQQPGRGFGLDVGVTYEWRPDFEQYQYRMDGKDWTDNSRNKYRLRVGLALTDLGSISYNNEQYVHQAKLANTRTVQLGQLDTVKVNKADDLAPVLQRLVGLESQSRRFGSALPTTVRLSADYRLLKHLFAGLLWTQNLLPATTVGQRSINSLALTPRIEFSHLEVATPVLLANNYRKVQVGAMLRLGPLVLGSDNIGGLFGLTTTTGADLYLSLGFALHRHKLHDKDGDQVSDKLDKCPKIKGPWELKGCPDTDGDLVPDAADECPSVAGLARFKGCPDTDGDGIPDKLDACPTVAGLVEKNGCPATGAAPASPVVPADSTARPIAPSPVAPAEPAEPQPAVPTATPAAEVPASPRPAAPFSPAPVVPAPNTAAPDADGDGIPDALDACPAIAGPADKKGCP
ncbi:DUF5723 family protein [Hymenobacter sp. DH14]|uniref:DUF5723 family protein n=1 Tax=Hymenobacter cyanobacteriorum TaxID=2926463 RepID=A0A9X2AFR2_9BACT|nr:DUF5723 family protein [Hymenobacter cyanobacteriorum]MCI1188451.1 DUF5723 family protein [Hymenobacter cyanobacteriorum]